MFPPSLHAARRRSSTSASSNPPLAPLRLRSSSLGQCRTFLPWLRRSDYISHLDPDFQRFTHYRTLRTRAKQLEKMRRRGKWNWNDSGHPFFFSGYDNSQVQIREASFWNGVGKGRHSQRKHRERTERDSQADKAYQPQSRSRNAINDDQLLGPRARKSKMGRTASPNDHQENELFQRLASWQSQVDALRDRIQLDTYGAVFRGSVKSFSSLASLMKMGLVGGHEPLANYAMAGGSENQQADHTPLSQRTQSMREREKWRSLIPEELASLNKVDKPAPSSVGNADSAASASEDSPSTDVDATPNGQQTTYSYAATTTTSWDSWTNKARRQEWDSQSGVTRYLEYDPISNRMVPSPSEAPVSGLNEILGETPDSAQEIPVQKFSATEMNLRQEPDGVSANQEGETTAIAISRDFEGDPHLEALTAEDIRAGMGSASRASKTRKGNATLKEQQQRVRNDLDAMLDTFAAEAAASGGSASRENTQKSLWELAEQDVLLERELEKLDSTGSFLEADSKPSSLMDVKTRIKDTLQSALARWRGRQPEEPCAPSTDTAVVEKDQAGALETPCGDRIRKNIGLGLKPYVPAMVQALQEVITEGDLSSSSAAAVHDAQRRRSSTNSDSQGSELLIEREKFQKRIRELRKELDTTFIQSARQASDHVDIIRGLEKKLDEADADKGTAAPDFARVEKKYKEKIDGLRKEVDTAYQQSIQQATQHIDRIRQLETELADVKGTSGNATAEPQHNDSFQSPSDALDNIARQQRGRPSPVEAAAVVEFQHEHPTPASASVVADALGEFEQKHRPQTSFREDAFYDPEQPQAPATSSEVVDGLSDFEQKHRPQTTFREDEIFDPSAHEATPQSSEADVVDALSEFEQKHRPQTKFREDDYYDPDQHDAPAQPAHSDVVEALSEFEQKHHRKTTYRTEKDYSETVHHNPPTPRSTAEVVNALSDFERKKREHYEFQRGDSEVLSDEIAREEAWAERGAHEGPFVKSLEDTRPRSWQSPPMRRESEAERHVRQEIPMEESLASSLQSFDTARPETLADTRTEDVPPNKADVGSLPRTTHPTAMAGRSQAHAENFLPPVTRQMNPIDGTTAPSFDEPDTFRFASPTGFVGDRYWQEDVPTTGASSSPDGQQTEYSRGLQRPPVPARKLEPRDQQTPRRPTTPPSAPTKASNSQLAQRRVRRSEPVFSGWKSESPAPGNTPSEWSSSSNDHAWASSAAQGSSTSGPPRTWGAAIRWTLGVGTAAAAAAYGIGAAAEKAQMREKEQWERRLLQWEAEQKRK